jgi:hypothetical protein
MWKGKFLLVENVFEDTRTRRGLVKEATRTCKKGSNADL